MFNPSVTCSNLLLAFDEADLSLHPKWQQKYLYWLLGFVESVFPMCKVHIIIATHSPIMLSDFPQNNVLYLDDSGKNLKRDIKTFGSNIHSLFLDSFFLNSTGTIGEFAENKINEVVRQLNHEELSKEKLSKILTTIHYVGDDLVRGKLLQLYRCKADKPLIESKKEENVETIDMTIEMLKMQKKQIEQMIKELSGRKMIKIRISDTSKQEILGWVYEDAKKETTGLLNVLGIRKNKIWLKKYFIELYNLFYINGKVNEFEVKKLLSANRVVMQEYIAKLGKYDKKNQINYCKEFLDIRIFRIVTLPIEY